MDTYGRAAENSPNRNDIDVQPDPEKCSEPMPLVADLLRGDQFGGAVKMNKVMYFAEFAHVHETGLPISGVPYQKLEHGPALGDYRTVRQALVDAGAAAETKERFLGLTQNRLVQPVLCGGSCSAPRSRRLRKMP